MGKGVCVEGTGTSMLLCGSCNTALPIFAGVILDGAIHSRQGILDDGPMARGETRRLKGAELARTLQSQPFVPGCLGNQGEEQYKGASYSNFCQGLKGIASYQSTITRIQE